jgi:CubicO group peptidase (beta-lactamase class C family)
MPLASPSLVSSCVKNLALLALLLVPSLGVAQHRAPAERFPAELDRYIARNLADWKIPGLAVAIVRNDSLLMAKGYGVRELGKPELVDGNTVFDVASLGKSFTATAAAILVDRGQLRWDDPVVRYLPDLVLPTPELTAQATVRDFLSHRTGLEAANMMWVPTAVDLPEVLRRMRYLRVVQPLRTSMIYSNVGVTVAGAAAAAAAHTSFEFLLRDLLIKPLGLTSTTWSYEQAATMPNRAASHAIIDGLQRPIRRETQRDATAPAGAVQSSVTDLARWMRLHLNNGMLDGKRYVSESAMKEMHTVQTPIVTTAAMRAGRMVQDSAGVGYGMGWQALDWRGHRMFWHTGNGDGQIAFMAILPNEKLGVVVVVNTWAAPMVHGALVSRILDTYLGYEQRDWAGEALARVPAMVAAGESTYAALVGGKDSNPPTRPLSAYAGRYEEPLFGPVLVRASASGLTLQMGEGGQIADLEYHHPDAFLVQWKDPVFREYYTTMLRFMASGDSVTSLRVRISRDEFTATKAGAAPRRDTLAWQPSWPNTQMAVVSGDPFRAGPFVFRFRMPDNYWICPHTHPIDARIKVISGAFLVGMGENVVRERARVLAVGDSILVNTGMLHYEGSRGETVIEISGNGPWGIKFRDAKDDPSAGGVCGVALRQ